jgi:hypothetical protein
MVRDTRMREETIEAAVAAVRNNTDVDYLHYFFFSTSNK